MLIFWGREVNYSVIALKLKISQWMKYFAPSDGLQLLLLCVGPYRTMLYTCFMCKYLYYNLKELFLASN